MENKITPEQIEKAKACKTVEELITLAKENGIELTEAEATSIFAMLNPQNDELSDSELKSVAGGFGNRDIRCPVCNSRNMKPFGSVTGLIMYRCQQCSTICNYRI